MGRRDGCRIGDVMAGEKLVIRQARIVNGMLVSRRTETAVQPVPHVIRESVTRTIGEAIPRVIRKSIAGVIEVSGMVGEELRPLMLRGICPVQSMRQAIVIGRRSHPLMQAMVLIERGLIVLLRSETAVCPQRILTTQVLRSSPL